MAAPIYRKAMQKTEAAPPPLSPLSAVTPQLQTQVLNMNSREGERALPSKQITQVLSVKLPTEDPVKEAKGLEALRKVGVNKLVEKGKGYF